MVGFMILEVFSNPDKLNIVQLHLLISEFASVAIIILWFLNKVSKCIKSISVQWKPIKYDDEIPKEFYENRLNYLSNYVCLNTEML